MKKYKKHKKILPSHHSGRVVHHRHTSYGGLALLMLLAVSALSFASRGVSQAAATDPVTDEYGTYAVVPGEIPRTAPVIRTVQSGTVFTSGDPITVGGSCPADTLIKIFKNDVFGGATLCNNQNFSLDIDLFIGSNTLVAKAYNGNNIPGPDSAPVVVTRNLAGGEIPPYVPAQQFFVTSDIYYKGINVGEELKWPVTLSGGQPPYAVNVGWGDGKTDLISRKEPGSFDIAHIYLVPGQGSRPHHTITITATDQHGSKSFIQLVTVVVGNDPGIISGVKRGYDLSGPIRAAWQILAIIAIVVFSFWLGERREAYVLTHAMGKA